MGREREAGGTGRGRVAATPPPLAQDGAQRCEGPRRTASLVKLKTKLNPKTEVQP